jgi:hypothetical protein
MALPCRPSFPRLFGAIVLVLLANPAFTQLNNGNLWPTPKLASVFPAGGNAGSTVEVNFAGVDLDQPEYLWFSHPGIKAVPVPPPAPPEPKVEEKKSDDPKAAEEKKAEPKKTEAKKDPPAVTKLTVNIDKDVPPGLYDVRLVSGRGISNPRVFVVSDTNEVLEKEPNNDVEQAQKIEIGSTVNGAISAPTDVDYFQFAAKKGQRVLLHVAGASIDSRLHPEIRVFDLANRQLAYTRAMPNEDALLDFSAPADGEFLIRLNQFTYTAGTADHFYRLHIGPGPWIDAVFPPVAEPGKPASIALYGRGLPGGQPDPSAVLDGKELEKLTVTIDAPANVDKLDVLGSIPPHQGMMNGFEYRLGNSNPKFIAFAQAPVVVENDDNDTAEQAQMVKLPCEIVGRVDKKRDRDWFAFEAKKGETYVIDAASQRLGAPTDLYYKLINAAKKQEITLQDDNAETVHPRGYYTANRDPQPFKFAVPEDGKYLLMVGSHSADIVAGPTHIYRVRIAPEKPDFQLIVIPAEDYRADSCTLGRGGVNYFHVFALRQDGFKGEIALTIEGLPTGVSCPPQVLAASSKQTMLAVAAADDAPEKFEGVIKVVGTSAIGGQKVVREARPASVTWGAANPQGNTPTITRLDRALVLAVRNKAPLNVTPTKNRVVIVVGDKTEIPYKLTRLDPEFKGSFQVQAVPGELPAGIAINNLTFAPGKDEQTLTLTAQPALVPGSYNLILRGFAPIAPPKGKNVNTILPTAPVTVVAIPKQIAALSLDNANPSLKVGGEAVVTLKVARQFDYQGEFKVQLLPDNANGVTAPELTIGPGQNDAKMTLKIAEGTNPGPRQNLTLRAVAVLEGVNLNHDLKFNVNVIAEPKDSKDSKDPKEPKK